MGSPSAKGLVVQDLSDVQQIAQDDLYQKGKSMTVTPQPPQIVEKSLARSVATVIIRSSNHDATIRQELVPLIGC